MRTFTHLLFFVGFFPVLIYFLFCLKHPHVCGETTFEIAKTAGISFRSGHITPAEFQKLEKIFDKQLTKKAFNLLESSGRIPSQTK
jgi:hypothetical protein